MVQFALRPNCISTKVTGNRLQTLVNALSNVCIIDPFLPSKTDASFTFAGLWTLAHNRPTLATARLLVYKLQ